MIDLTINPDSIRSSFGGASTQIFSEIYFSINGEFFPEEGWDDFSAIILGWWLTGTISIMRQKPFKKTAVKDGERFYFMDGNYYFSLSTEGDLFNINFTSNPPCFGVVCRGVGQRPALGLIVFKEWHSSFS